MPTIFRFAIFEWWARFALPTLRTVFATDFFLAVAFFAAAFFTTFFAALRAFGRLRNAARCAAASAALAHTLSSSESSNSRAGNCQYEFTVTVLARV